MLKAEGSRVLIRAPNWLGDAVLSLAAVRDLRRNFPEARLTVLARESVLGLYGAISEVDDVLASHGVRADAAALRGRFDTAVLLPNSFGTAWAAWRAGIPERWGWATDGRGLLLTRGAAVPARLRGENQVYYYRAMLEAVGLQVSPGPETALRCPPEWAARGAALLGEGEWVGLAPGAHFGGAKRWLPERFASVARGVARDTGAGVVVLGGAGEAPLAARVSATLDAPALDLCGRTSLPELVGVLSRLRLLVTNDSGPMHVAAALGTPVVAVFGPTDWRETAPVGERHRLLREPVHCSPCLLRECPIDHRCMERVTAERVLDEARSLLRPEPPAGGASLPG